MPSFRSPANQARKLLARHTAHGSPRHGHHKDQKIHSLGTERSYRDSLTRTARWLREQGHLDGLHKITPALALAYLHERAPLVSQSTLDCDRQSLQLILDDKLDRIKSRSEKITLRQRPRAYGPDHVATIAAHQTPANALATNIAYAAGLRAHELGTLAPITERPPSSHREWDADRFGGGRQHWVSYTVIGKGGLIREVRLPPALAHDLEAVRLAEPQATHDRGIHGQTRYAIGHGQAWSQSFTAASRAALGWSTGAHGLRHGYTHDRVDELQSRGYSFAEAKALISQELGHFRPDITTVYLR